MRKLGQEPSRTVILRIPGEWWREFNALRRGGTMSGILRDALEDYLRKAGKLAGSAVTRNHMIDLESWLAEREAVWKEVVALSEKWRKREIGLAEAIKLRPSDLLNQCADELAAILSKLQGATGK